MTEQDFLKIFTNHVRSGQKYFVRSKVLKSLEIQTCPFHVLNHKKPPIRPEDGSGFRETNEFRDAGGYYVFHATQELRGKMIEIIEKEWKEQRRENGITQKGKV
jgi:hypothetical protein